MQKKTKKPVDKNAWMNTYSDMVTLLLCFFVLLFSVSSVDSAKWSVLVKALNPKAKEVSQIVTEEMAGEEGKDPLSSGGKGLMTDVTEFQDLYYRMEEYIIENKLSGDIDVHQGDGYTFIVFRNDVFFDGDSYVLKQRGKDVLTFLASGIEPIQDQINEMRILGHTNQADPNKPNPIVGDRFLASNRATTVLIFIQEKSVIDPKKLIDSGYGQNYPIAPFVKEEDRARNRRVEILITESNKVSVTLEEVYKQIDEHENVTEGPGEQGESVGQPLTNTNNTEKQSQ
ncbi:OmpA/MotB family protein [Sinanaerobacter sp. ZZT-01]|uniref:OmpA/MotB family protein n=1 Tax=Sinanaerobacter sp. ZZT-01 TaxID=3111540 RepID=UPI002D79C902|nr:flagellar motor protein MotB [Sinanaerobacter sp. ZZT-01]WRR93599.1 flagellar motor protein MotB [Sinanaerobacter sp. ZZT-01]